MYADLFIEKMPENKGFQRGLCFAMQDKRGLKTEKKVAFMCDMVVVGPVQQKSG